MFNGLDQIAIVVRDTDDALKFYRDSVPQGINAMPEHGLESRDSAPRRGPLGRQAAFIKPETTRGVLFEITAEPSKG